PAASLGVSVVSNHVVSNLLVVIPNRLLLFFVASVDPRRDTRLLAKIEALAISNEQIARDNAIRRRGEHDSRLRSPCARRRGEAIPDNHVVMRVQAVGDLVKNSSVFVIGDQTISDRAIFIADVEPDSAATVFDKSALLQNH